MRRKKGQKARGRSTRRRRKSIMLERDGEGEKRGKGEYLSGKSAPAGSSDWKLLPMASKERQAV